VPIVAPPGLRVFEKGDAADRDADPLFEVGGRKKIKSHALSRYATKQLAWASGAP
jgi:hypothetical protein